MNTKISLILALLACFGSFSAMALQPEVDYSPRFMSIDNVERTPDGTRIDVTLKHRPHYWVMVDSAVVLTDESTGRTFRLIGHENISPSTKIWMPDSGHHQGKLFFESIPEDVKVVDMLVPDEEDVFAYGIHLDEPRIDVNPTGMSKEEFSHVHHTLKNGTDCHRKNTVTWSLYDREQPHWSTAISIIICQRSDSAHSL